MANVCKSLLRWRTAAIALAVAAALPTARAQWTTQTLTLSAGWNPVYLNIAPATADCDALFGVNSRIVSVRRWAPPPVDAVQYDETTGATLPLGGSWLTWFPTNHPDRALMNLSQAAGNAAYLIELSAGSPVTLNLQGRPLAQTYEWQPGGQHFLGLPVYSAAINFSAFFAAAGSNIVVDYRNGGELYQVLTNGAHQRIFTPTTTAILPGAAYWVKAQQYSTYAGPINLKVGSGASWMDFGRLLSPQYLEIRNETAVARGLKIAHLSSSSPPAGTPALAGLVPLKYAVIAGSSEAQGRAYASLPSTWSTQLLAGATLRLAFIPDVSALGTGNANAAFQSILEVTDDVGQPGVVRQKVGVRAMARAGTTAESRGLWVGEVSVTNVGRLEMPGVYGLATTPRPVARSFTFRLLAHVDAAGTARLLQRVFVGTRSDTTNGGVITDLMATEDRVSAYKTQYPSAKILRLSSVNFPFMSPLQLTNGAFGVPNQVVLGRVNMTNTDPVNPFRHAFAPLHDNVERRAEDNIPYNRDVEVFSIRRDITMTFQGPDQVGAEPRWGETVCGGVYKEEIYGLGGDLSAWNATNRMITVQGSFVMQRASPVATLLQ